MSDTETAQDRAYCRTVLPRVSRTFAINIRLLTGSLGESVRIAYLLCRAADALEDSWPGEAADIGLRFDLFAAAIAGDPGPAAELARQAGALPSRRADMDLVAELPRVWRRYRALPDADREAVAAGVDTLARGMRRYAVRDAERRAPDSALRPYLDDEAELRDYCWVVAGCIGVMLTRLFSRRAESAPERERERLELAPWVGEGLQLTNILLDWPSDVRRGRCFVPAAWLDAHGLTPAMLVGADSAAVRAVAERLHALARAALERVPDYLETIPARHVRYRLFCLWPALWALGSLRHARRDPHFPAGPRRPRLPRTELWGAALGSLVNAHRPAALRRFYLAWE